MMYHWLPDVALFHNGGGGAIFFFVLSGYLHHKQFIVSQK